jgi:hypothetical protein
MEKNTTTLDDVARMINDGFKTTATKEYQQSRGRDGWH